METTTVNQGSDNKLSAIERALAAAKARKAAQAAAQPSAAEEKPVAKKEKAPKAPREDKSAARVEKQAQIAREREERKAARAEKKTTKAAAAAETRKPAHMKKVERAAAKLPALNDSAQLLFNEAVGNFSADQLTAIALHLQHHNRVAATQRAVATKLEVGMQVRITGGEPRFVGKTGTVSEVRRIRRYVEVPGVSKPVYVFTSDVEAVAASEEASAA